MSTARRKTKRKTGRKTGQGGGTFLGLILGMMVGLGVALAVAFYVSRLPNPFVAKNPSRLASREALDSSRDPNAALRSRGEVQPLPPVERQQTTAEDVQRATEPREAPPEKAPRAVEEQRPAQPAPAPAPAEARAPAPQRQSADPLGDLIAARSRANAMPQAAPQTQRADPFTYYVQAGAFRLQADADAQRARLLLLGVQASVTQRDQAGRPIWRVRVGPFQNQDAADRTKARLAENGFDAALVRVQR